MEAQNIERSHAASPDGGSQMDSVGSEVFSLGYTEEDEADISVVSSTRIGKVRYFHLKSHRQALCWKLF